MLQQIVQVGMGAARQCEGQLQHLVEVAVVETTPPVHAHQLTAHAGPQIVVLVGITQGLQVLIELASADEGTAEALDGHVGKGEQVVEDDAPGAAPMWCFVLRVADITCMASRPCAIWSGGPRQVSKPALETGNSYDNALAEMINGLYEAELICRWGLWKNLAAVGYATLEWVEWFSHRRLLGAIGNVPLVELGAVYCLQREEAVRSA